jgi:hypothetical protein
MWALCLAVFVGLSCSKSDEQPTPAAPKTPESKSTAAAVRQMYPIDCAAADAWWKWATCHDTTKGFAPLLACVTAARDESDAARNRLPAAQEASEGCAGTVETQSRAFVTMTALLLDDVVTWLATHQAALTGPLRATSLQDLDNDHLKAGLPQEWDKRYGGHVAKGQAVRSRSPLEFATR